MLEQFIQLDGLVPARTAGLSGRDLRALEITNNTLASAKGVSSLGMAKCPLRGLLGVYREIDRSYGPSVPGKALGDRLDPGPHEPRG